MAFFLLIQANDMEQTVVSLPRGTNPHRQHREGSPREGFPSSSLHTEGGSSALPTPPLSPARPCPCPPPVVTSLVTPHNLSGGWVQPQLLAVVLPSSPASLVQLQHQRGDSSRKREPWVPLDLPHQPFMVSCRHSTWGAAQPRSSCFSLLFYFFLFTFLDCLLQNRGGRLLARVGAVWLLCLQAALGQL